MYSKTLTIITVTYNSAKTLQKTIDSISSQKDQRIEFIIIDGASTDETVDMIKKNSSCIDYWISEKDKGIYDAMNKGVKIASGKYIAFMNSDDWYISGNLKKAVDELEKLHADIIYGDTVITSEDFEIGTRVADKPKPGTILTRMPFCHQSCFVSKRVIDELGGFNANFKLVSDFNMIISILKNPRTKVHSLNFPVSAFSTGGASSNLPKAAKETYIIHRQHGMNFFLAYLLYVKWLMIGFVKAYSPRQVETWLRIIKTKYRL